MFSYDGDPSAAQLKLQVQTMQLVGVQFYTEKDPLAAPQGTNKQTDMMQMHSMAAFILHCLPDPTTAHFLPELFARSFFTSLKACRDQSMHSTVNVVYQEGSSSAYIQNSK